MQAINMHVFSKKERGRERQEISENRTSQKKKNTFYWVDHVLGRTLFNRSLLLKDCEVEKLRIKIHIFPLQ